MATELCVAALWAQKNKQGEVNYTGMLSSNICPICGSSYPDGQVGVEGQQNHHQGYLHHFLGGQKHQVGGGPTFYEVSY